MTRRVAAVIGAKGLTKHYGDLTAVDGISFAVERGTCFGILGPNGAGKTTTIRMAYGFSPVTSGELRVFGLDVTRDLPANVVAYGNPARVMREIGEADRPELPEL